MKMGVGRAVTRPFARSVQCDDRGVASRRIARRQRESVSVDPQLLHCAAHDGTKAFWCQARFPCLRQLRATICSEPTAAR